MDASPIRTGCFSPSGDYFVVGTNSKALKICAVPKVNERNDLSGEDNESAMDSSGVVSERKQDSPKVNVVLEQCNHHVGSIYCVDWTKTEHLLATGSNDRLIKLLVCPDLTQHTE